MAKSHNTTLTTGDPRNILDRKWSEVICPIFVANLVVSQFFQNFNIHFQWPQMAMKHHYRCLFGVLGASSPAPASERLVV